jgi:uncharacterized membrane protein YeaQ/YmgE (transglycosylase-associated protein family)
MYLLAWIVFGAVVGWGAGRIFQGNGYGPLMDTLMGMGGAVVGGFTMSSAGIGGYGGTHHNPGCNGWRSASDCTRRLRERQKALRSPSLTYARAHGEGFNTLGGSCRRLMSLPDDVRIGVSGN